MAEQSSKQIKTIKSTEFNLNKGQESSLTCENRLTLTTSGPFFNDLFENNTVFSKKVEAKINELQKMILEETSKVTRKNDQKVVDYVDQSVPSDSSEVLKIENNGKNERTFIAVNSGICL